MPVLVYIDKITPLLYTIRHMYAVFPVGGLGERMNRLVGERPKPMLPVGGIPILARQLVHFRNAGVTDVILAEGYKSEVIQDYFKDGKAWGINVHHLDQGVGPSPGERIRLALAEVPETEKDVFVSVGDVLTDVALGGLLKQHREKDSVYTLFTLPPFKIPSGIIMEDFSNGIADFMEKPIIGDGVNSGIAVIQRESYPTIPDGAFFGPMFEMNKTRSGSFKDPDAYWLHAEDEAAYSRMKDQFNEIRATREGGSIMAGWRK